MPIYMDRHDVSKEVTAEMVADLHQKDLRIQHKFNCKGLTYWFDEKRKTAFCLIEAPNQSALKEMHDQAHGQVPHRIIEVDNAIVESFLGRIEDPEKSQKTALNIINDPAFRTIMVVGVRPLSYNEKVGVLLKEQQAKISETIDLYRGRLVKKNTDHFLVSFESVTNAVLCALKIHEEFEKSSHGTNNLLKLNIGLSAGVPVEEKDGFFEDTIKTAYSNFELVKGTVVLSPEVRDLYESENLNSAITSGPIVALKPAEEKFLRDLVEFMEKKWNNTTLQTDDFCQHLGFSKSRLYRRLSAITGKSPNTFLKEYRLSRARDLLTRKNFNISEVAFETGFNSPAYFSKCFQETFGILPSAYIRSANY